MNPKRFQDSLHQDAPPPRLNEALLALWWDAKGDSKRAHELVQEDGSTESAWVHAYLHRKEGDRSNAAYWYQMAGRRPISVGDFHEEWEEIVVSLLAGRI